MVERSTKDYFSLRPESSAYLENDLGDLLKIFSGDQRKIGELIDLLISKHSENHRAYHNLSHVFSLLYKAETCETGIADDASLRLAVWFHDAVYDPQSQTNEIESAALAVESLTRLSVPEAKIEKVEKMILATRTHDALGLDEDGKLFLDLDLGILAADQDIYRRYANAIRREYSFVPEELYREKRREILARFLEREYIYFTAERRYSDEEPARSNIANEIEELS